MKQKLTLLLLALFTTVGAWATSTYFVSGRSASITTGKQYMIYNTARRYFISANGTAYAVTSSTAPLSYTTTSANYVWTLEEGSTSGTYKIKNVGTSTYSAGGKNLGSAVDYTIAEFSTCPSKGGMNSYNDDGTQTASASITSANNTVYIVQSGTNVYWNGTGDSFNTTGAAHVYVLYEVVEIADDACYTISFQSKATTKTWGLRAGTTRQTPLAEGTGDVFVAHSYTNLAGAKRWIFVNNSNGEYLAYSGDATSSFNISHAINEWNISSLIPGNYVSADANVTGKLCITNDKRYTNKDSRGCYVVNESTGAYDNSDGPYFNGSYTSALIFTATGDAVSSAATLAIAKFDALNEVRGYLAYASNISALFGDPSGVENAINAAADADAAASAANTFMKSPEGKKFYAVNSTATGNYLNLGTSQITATATKLYADAIMEVEYAGNAKYYLKGVKSGYYAGNPNSGSANPGTVSAKENATPLYIGNYANSADNVVYFARTKQSNNNPEAIHYNSDYQSQGNVVAWSYDAGASQWNITAISDDDYNDLLNVCNVSYKVLIAASGEVKASQIQTEVIGSTFTTVPSGIAKDFASYTFYSDASCTSPLTTVPNVAETTVYALAATAGDAPFVASDNYSTATWYNLKLNDTYPSYADATPNVTLPSNPSSTENNVEWAFVGNPYDGYQIINKAAGDGKVLGAASAASDENTGANTYATFATASTQTHERWFPKSSTYATNGFYLFDEENYALNKRSNDNLAFWTEGYDAGSTFVASAVTDNSAELAGIVNGMEAKSFGSNYGEYRLTGDYASHESQMAESILPALETYSFKNLLVARALDAAKSLNIPQAGDFLRIKASATNKSAYTVSDDIYLTSSNTQSDVNNSTYKDNRVGFKLGAASDNTTIFYYDAESHLTGFANGFQPTNNSNQMKIGGVGATATIVTFESIEDTENKAFRVEFNNGQRSLYTQRYDGVYFTDAAGGNATDSHYRYFLEKVTVLPITMNSVDNKYYGTINLPVAVTIPEGVYAYKAAVAGDVMTLTKVVENGVLAANTPVVLYSASEVTSLAISAEAGTGADDDAFRGTTAAITAPAGTNYVLNYSSTEGVGFYKYTGSVIPGFKAYFNVPSGSPVKGFSFSMEDVETAIRAIESENNDLEIYDIAGRRVPQAQKGLYIVNGKKVMFK